MLRLASVLLVGLLLAGPAFAKKNKDKTPPPEPAAEAPATGVTQPSDLIGEWNAENIKERVINRPEPAAQ